MRVIQYKISGRGGGKEGTAPHPPGLGNLWVLRGVWAPTNAEPPPPIKNRKIKAPLEKFLNILLFIYVAPFVLFFQGVV